MLGEQVLHDAFGGRRTADIAEANEEDAVWHGQTFQIKRQRNS
jgi:hypothetical protein